MNLYATWEDTNAFDFVKGLPTKDLADLADDNWIARPDTPNELRKLAMSLSREIGITILTAELTYADTAEFGHVVKVVVPEMLPLSQDHGARWLASSRLLSRIASDHDPSKVPPHPFA